MGVEPNLPRVMLYRPWVFEQPLTVPPTAYTSLVCLYIVTGKQLVNKPSSCDYVKKKKICKVLEREVQQRNEVAVDLFAERVEVKMPICSGLSQTKWNELIVHLDIAPRS